MFTLPFPLSFSANALQHGEQMSYSLPSISFWRHSLAWLHRSHRLNNHGSSTTSLPSFYMRKLYAQTIANVQRRPAASRPPHTTSSYTMPEARLRQYHRRLSPKEVQETEKAP